MEFVLLAPGPSISRIKAEECRGKRVGVIGNCYELAPWAEFLAANDRAWWKAHLQAKAFVGRKFSGSKIDGVEHWSGAKTNWNSGVLALDIAVGLGASSIRLYGFDMHGSHFFGPYENGLANTSADRRALHQKQYQRWKEAHPGVAVKNCTPGSALIAYPYEGQE